MKLSRKSILPFLPLLGLALSAGPLLGAEGAGTHESKTVIQIVLEGGPLIITIWMAILLTSVTMVTLVIQNFITLRKEKLAPRALVSSLANTLQSGNYQEAWEICKANHNYLANVMRTGLERFGRGKSAVEDAISESGLREAQLVRTRNSYLSVIGVISPMIGLLGTVIGMMGAFATLGASGVGDTRKLAQSIGEVLLATASGLFIAIPAFVFYYIFRNRAQVAIVHADDQINRLLQEIPFEELEGIKIGDRFSAGGEAGEPAPHAAPAPTVGHRPGAAPQVAHTLTTNCPICHGPIPPGTTPCPHCGAALQW